MEVVPRPLKHVCAAQMVSLKEQISGSKLFARGATFVGLELAKTKSGNWIDYSWAKIMIDEP